MWLSYNENYDVSSDGEVRNRKSGRILKPSNDAMGYFIITLSNDGIHKTITVHKMVGERFLPKVDIPGLVIDHIDRDKTNNSASNLRWCSQSVNRINSNTNRLGMKNIYKHKKFGTYRVAIDRNYIRVYQKSFKTLEEAILNRDNFIASHVE